jgi:hypothetical protein
MRSILVPVLCIAAACFAAEARGDKPMLYWSQTDFHSGTMQRSPLAGEKGVFRTVLRDIERPWGMALDLKARKMYWADYALGVIKRANLDGTDVETVVDKAREVFDIEIDFAEGKLYWVRCGAGDQSVMERANLDGGKRERLSWAGTHCFAAVAIDPVRRKVYWTQFHPEDRLRRANLDGTDIEDVVLGGVRSGGIALDTKAGKIYWTSDDQEISWANLDGSGASVLRKVDGNVMALLVDEKNGHLYWSLVDQDGLIQRGSLDGTGDVETVIKDSGPAFGMALDLDGGPDKLAAADAKPADGAKPADPAKPGEEAKKADDAKPLESEKPKDPRP